MDKVLELFKRTKIEDNAISDNRVFIGEIIYWLAFIGAIMLKCFYFQFTTKLNVRPFFSSFNLYMLLSSFGILLMMVSIFVLLFNKKRAVALLWFNAFLTLLILADTLYFRYYYNAITISVFYQIGLVGSVGESIKNLFKIKDIIFILDFPFLIAGLIILNKFSRTGINKVHIVKRLVCAMLIAVIGFAGFKVAYTHASVDVFAYDNNYIINNLGIFYFHNYDIKKYIKDNYLTDKTLDDNEKAMVNTFYDSKTKNGDNYYGIAKGKNLLVVQLEAFQQFVINKEVNGKEITPNLNKFINEGFYFENFYYQTGGGNTSDAEFLCNTSLYPIRDGAVYFRFPTNTYYSMPKLLKEQGYKTNVFHAFNPSFWNRTEMYKAIGFDAFTSNKNFILDEKVGWGLSDTSFFRQSLDILEKNKPFYGFLVTLSNHHPYDSFISYKDFDSGEYTDTLFGNFLKGAHYTDMAFAKLIDELKQRGLYDNTVLVVYGDHAAVQKAQAEELKKFIGYDGSELEWLKLQKVPCFIHIPGQEKGGVISTAGGQLDLLPTIANLMGFDAPYSLGKDLLNTDYGYAVLTNYNVITDKYYYLNATEEVFDNNGMKLKKEDYLNEIKELQNQVQVANIIIRKDAFKGKLK